MKVAALGLILLGIVSQAFAAPIDEYFHPNVSLSCAKPAENHLS
jgi:hypothetical protein